jgi:H+-transporting ATPase
MGDSKRISDFQLMSSNDAIKLLQSDLNSGLKETDVKKRMKQYGYNEVPEKKTHPVLRFLAKFWGLSAWMLEVIIILSWFLHRVLDAYIVSALLISNGVISFIQEQHAENTVEKLKKKLQINAKVLRDKTWKIVQARELVPGDILRIRTGDFVPADIKIIDGKISVDQSALTGESLAVEKTSGNIVYSGSIVSMGEATAIVVLTGPNTYFGKTIQLVQTAKPKMHIDRITAEITKLLLGIVVALLSVTVIISIVQGINLLEILPLMLVLLLGAVPVALPAMFTVSMALGSLELAEKRVLVTRLSAIDDAASMDVLCVDKTGTITMNRMSIAKLIPVNKYNENELLLYGALASQEADKDSIDLAFINLARKKNLLSDLFVQEEFIPFDPKTRMTKATIKHNERRFQVIKGSFSVIAETCGLNKNEKEGLENRIVDLAKNGYRTLAVAKAEEGKKPEIVGLVALHDPVRPDSKRLIEELKELGVSVKMLTGDAVSIAREIAKEIGLGSKITDVSELKRLKTEEIAEIAERSDGIAEIYPEDKYLIVKSFQAKGHIVGMTGDGVNDAPALKQAEVGIAVSNSTDVAKGAASIVLTDEGLVGIVEPIKIGRMTFQRVNTWILNKIMRTIMKICFVVVAFLLLGKFVITASAMLIMVFMTDYVKISLATDNVRWSKKPSVWNIEGLIKIGTVLGLVMLLEALGLLYIGLNYFNLVMDDVALGTFSFELLLFFALFSIFVTRERGHFWDSVPSKTLLLVILLDMILGVIISTFGLFGFKAIPLPVTMVVIGYSLIFALIVNDLIKAALLKKLHMDAE